MDEIKRPNLKGKDVSETIKSIEKYLFTISDQLNWNLLTLENRQTYQGRTVAKYTEELEHKIKATGEGSSFVVIFKKIGQVIYGIASGTEDEESSGTAGEIDVKIPSECTTSFFDASIPMSKGEGISIFLKEGKITIDYDFTSKKQIGAYFQYAI